MAALTTRTDNTATNVVSNPISTYNSRDILFSSAFSVFISPTFYFHFLFFFAKSNFFFGSEVLLVTEQFRKVLNKSLSFLISFLFQLLLFQKVLIGFEFFKFCDSWLFDFLFNFYVFFNSFFYFQYFYFIFLFLFFHIYLHLF